MSKLKKIIAGAIIVPTIGICGVAFASTYTVQPGDSFWKISKKVNVKMDELMKANSANERTIIYPGQKLAIPGSSSNGNVVAPSTKPNMTSNTYKVQPGDTLWRISNKFNIKLDELMKLNNLKNSTIIYVGQNIKLGSESVQNQTPSKPTTNNNTGNNTNSDHKYIVKAGDGLWAISKKVGMNLKDLLALNNLKENSTIYVGQVLKIDKPYKAPQDSNTTNKPNTQDNKENETVSTNSKYGEPLDWFKEVQYLIPRGTNFKVTDFYTGKTFMLHREYGTNHADVEALTAKDTETIKQIWGGFSWVRRPVIVEAGGKKIAASLAGMPHAGNEKAPAGAYTTWRSGDYGPGTNLDYIKGNNMDGHMDLHFLNSLGHANPTPNADHQKAVKIAAGIN